MGVEFVNLQQEVEQRVRDALPGSEVTVEVDGNRASIRVASDSFAAMSRVRRHQAVYACIEGLIADGTLHAVSIEASPGSATEGA